MSTLPPICGPRPHVVIFAGVHGDEIASRFAAAILAQSALVVGPITRGKHVDPAQAAEISGTLTVFPNANPASCIACLRYAPTWAGGDEFDLNRSFGPFHTSGSGRPSGSPERLHALEISAWIEDHRPSLVIDMHEGQPAARTEGLTPIWYAVDDTTPTSDADPEAFVPKHVAEVAEPSVWIHTQNNSLTGDCGRLGFPAVCQETDNRVGTVRSRVLLHLAGAVECARLAGLELHLDPTQVDFVMSKIAL